MIIEKESTCYSHIKYHIVTHVANFIHNHLIKHPLYRSTKYRSCLFVLNHIATSSPFQWGNEDIELYWASNYLWDPTKTAMKWSNKDYMICLNYCTVSIYSLLLTFPWHSINIIVWWRHQIETFSALLALCARNSPVTGEFPHKGQWRVALMFSLICAWINGWVNNREAGDSYAIAVIMTSQ